MPQPPSSTIREVFLEVIKESAASARGMTGPSLQQNSTLRAVAARIGPCPEEAILTQWHELFRTGLLAWGMNFSNPDPPFFHLTDRGHQALANATRDPSNPDGYIRHVQSMASLNPIAMSYLREGLDCYVAGLFKACAVMVGCSAESMILELRDATVQKLTTLGRSVPSKMNAWPMKTVSDALHLFIDGHRMMLSHDLRDAFDSYWSALAGQIRTTRNDAGHPTSVDPVTADTAHASLLVFPELARIANRLCAWVTNELT